ncbi:ABC transporter ATP-binding protein [Cellulomonas hominis]|uniref:ABC transporter ATP-binding protein n=1 Tax=Cellulomonas hominis TaxID=156981 RepID=UPI0014441691|nr:ABC transporter ATP-binding protein [Cellulomonas hominis]NKY09930.1 ABC transporter ATP-binding protein [Cellulomonas hominis]
MSQDTTEIISVTNVSKKFVLHTDKSLKERMLRGRRAPARSREDFWALRDIDLSVSAGTTIGLMGSNGSGKSTLLKIIGAIIQPTSGVVRRRGRLAALLELGAGFHPDLTGRENVFLNASLLGMNREETERHFDAIVAFSGIEKFIDNQVKFYSSGMYVRLAFAVAVHVDPDLLLVDEVLAVGDEPFQRKCMDKIRSFQAEGRTIVLVSHSADQVGDLCDRAVLLRRGTIEADDDPTVAIKALREGFEEDRRKAEENAATPDERTRGKIGKVQLLDRTGQPVSELAAGDDLIARVEVDLTEPIDDWMMGFALETPLGQRVYHVNSHVSGVRLAPGRGSHVVEFDLPDLRLGAGRYVARVGVAEVNGDMIDLEPQAATLDVSSGNLGNGVLDVRSSITAVS